MTSQREADLSVLMSVYSRSEAPESASKLYRVRNSLTTGGYLNVEQFNGAVDALLRLQMVELEGDGEDQLLRISSHGRTWLLSNFHWVRGYTATLQPNDEAWVMIPPENPPHSGSFRGAKVS